VESELAKGAFRPPLLFDGQNVACTGTSNERLYRYEVLPGAKGNNDCFHGVILCTQFNQLCQCSVNKNRVLIVDLRKSEEEEIEVYTGVSLRIQRDGDRSLLRQGEPVDIMQLDLEPLCKLRIVESKFGKGVGMQRVSIDDRRKP
jgi:hypothetical protein